MQKPPKHRRIARGLGRGSFLLFVIVVGFIASQLRSSATLALVIRNTPQLAQVVPLLPPAPELREEVGPTAGDPGVTGVLYLATPSSSQSGVLLVNGVEVPGGWRNPDIVTLARSIAYLGKTVYVPDLPGGLEQGTMTPETRSALDLDVAWFSEQLGGRPVTLVGVCAGASLALLAGEDQVSEVHAIIGLDPYAQGAGLVASRNDWYWSKC